KTPSESFVIVAFVGCGTRIRLPQAFEGCVVREWNLSMACLTSFKAREALRQMAKTNPEFWAELSVDHADDM
ncbi:hypothetical protein GALMADRAFT_260250, partial [Galerina marginata CBS 339.88]